MGSFCKDLNEKYDLAKIYSSSWAKYYERFADFLVEVWFANVINFGEIIIYIQIFMKERRNFENFIVNYDFS